MREGCQRGGGVEHLACFFALGDAGDHRSEEGHPVDCDDRGSDVLADLADHPNIAGIKDTSPSSLGAYLDAAGGRADFAVVAGSLNTIMAALDRGGPGGIVSAANYLPAQCARLTTLWHAGEHEAARSYYDRLLRLAKATGAAGGVAGVKASMDVLGFVGGAPRRPVAALDDAAKARLRATFDAELGTLDPNEG